MSLFSSNDEHFCTPFALHNKTNSDRRGRIETTRLEPENEYGNIEYKLRLTDPTPDRIERLVTQLKWRIREGHGEAIIFLGVKDNGLFVGLNPDEVRLSLQTLQQMSAKIGASMSIVNERIIDCESQEDDCHMQNANNRTQSSKTKRQNLKKRASRSKTCPDHHDIENDTHSMGLDHEQAATDLDAKKCDEELQRKVIQVLVKRKTHDISEELRVAVLGPTGSGKSSLLGVLSHGEHDNGRGSARLSLFRHRHEIRSGHTSSISQEIFGFNCHGQPLTYSNCLTTEEIIESSSRIVTLIDLAGHQRYLGTTLFGLGSHCPDIVLLVISAILPITNTTIDHISIALGMDKYLAIAINKIDLANQADQDACYEDLVRTLQKLHPDISPSKVTDVNEAMIAGNGIFDSKNLPIFFTSCVSGSGINPLYRFFNEISPILNDNDVKYAMSRPSELQVDETFEVPGIGTVVSGLMIEGIVREGDELLLGPDDRGGFSNVTIVSLQRHKIPCNFARAGQKCTMAITGKNLKVRRGMVMKELGNDENSNMSACVLFEAKVQFITNKQYKLGPGFQVSIYIGNVKQTCSIQSIDKVCPDTWKVLLRFTKRPEYIREGSKLILRHASTNGYGSVSKIVPLN